MTPSVSIKRYIIGIHYHVIINVVRLQKVTQYLNAASKPCHSPYLEYCDVVSVAG